MSDAAAIRMTSPTMSVLTLLLEEPDRAFYGLELMANAGIKSGTIYPILTRLEAIGWLESAWEDIDPAVAARPRRRYYRLTSVGLIAGTDTLRAVRDSGRGRRRKRRRPSETLAPNPA